MAKFRHSLNFGEGYCWRKTTLTYNRKLHTISSGWSSSSSKCRVNHSSLHYNLIVNSKTPTNSTYPHWIILVYKQIHEQIKSKHSTINFTSIHINIQFTNSIALFKILNIKRSGNQTLNRLYIIQIQIIWIPLILV